MVEHDVPFEDICSECYSLEDNKCPISHDGFHGVQPVQRALL